MGVWVQAVAVARGWSGHCHPWAIAVILSERHSLSATRCSRQVHLKSSQTARASGESTESFLLTSLHGVADGLQRHPLLNDGGVAHDTSGAWHVWNPDCLFPCRRAAGESVPAIPVPHRGGWLCCLAVVSAEYGIVSGRRHGGSRHWVWAYARKHGIAPRCCQELLPSVINTFPFSTFPSARW